jgi:mxaJ protein
VQIVGDDYANPPPAQALARRGLVRNVVGYPVYGNYADGLPLGPIIDGVVRGDIDVAIVWGPLGGWLAQRSPVPLTIDTIAASATDGDLPLSFAIGMGVRRDDSALRAELDHVVRTHRRALDALLRQFAVPLVPMPDARQP